MDWQRKLLWILDNNTLWIRVIINIHVSKLKKLKERIWKYNYLLITCILFVYHFVSHFYIFDVLLEKMNFRGHAKIHRDLKPCRNRDLLMFLECQEMVIFCGNKSFITIFIVYSIKGFCVKTRNTKHIFPSIFTRKVMLIIIFLYILHHCDGTIRIWDFFFVASGVSN